MKADDQKVLVVRFFVYTSYGILVQIFNYQRDALTFWSPSFF